MRSNNHGLPRAFTITNVWVIPVTTTFCPITAIGQTLTTETVLSTNEIVVTSCVATVMNCPARQTSTADFPISTITRFAPTKSSLSADTASPASYLTSLEVSSQCFSCALAVLSPLLLLFPPSSPSSQCLLSPLMKSRLLHWQLRKPRQLSLPQQLRL